MASAASSEDKVILNLMPMLDIFSILITFLLMSFSSDPVNYNVSRNVRVPESSSTVSLDEVPSIVVSKTEILVNDKKIVSIFDGDIQERSRSQGAIFPLFEELEKLAEASKSTTEDGKPSSILTMEMDKSHLFKLIKRVMLSAQQAEFVTFKLLVEKNTF